MKDTLLKVKLNGLYLIVFGALACYGSFLAVYFQQRGMSYSQIGVAFAVNSVVAVICQPLWGVITDKYLNKRLTLLITMLVSSILVFSFVFAKGFYPILISLFIFVIFQSPIGSVNDAYCYEIIDEHKSIQYGRVRLMGSIGWAVAALILGIVIKQTNINSTFIGYFILILISFAVVYTLKFRGKASGAKIKFSDIGGVLGNKRFIMLAISAMLVSASLSANGNYIAVLIQKTGGDVSKLGTLIFITAMSELPGFFLGNKVLNKYGILNVYMVSILISSLRFFADSVSGNYQLVQVIQLLQGLSFPFYVVATFQYVNSIVKSETRTTAITVFTAFTGGLGGIIGNMFGGFIIQNLNVFYLFKIMSLICIIALLIGLVLKVVDNKYTDIEPADNRI